MKRTLIISAMAGLTLLILSLSAPGCHQGTEAPQSEAGPDIAQAPKGGALFWSQNCMRCHNLRPPRERSDREWEIIVHHMRVRANLTAEEHRLILQFLKSAN